MEPSLHQFTVLKQIATLCKQIRCCRQAPASAFGGIDLIPGHPVPKLAREYGVDKKSRKFTPWSHGVSLVFTRLAHAPNLNDVSDAPLDAKYGAWRHLFTVRGPGRPIKSVC